MEEQEPYVVARHAVPLRNAVPPRDTIKIFAQAMENKLQRDDHQKSAWETDSMFLLFDDFQEEINELFDALQTYQATADDPEGQALRLECVDVALCAMMIFSQLHPLTRHNRRGNPVHAMPRIK